MSAEFANRSNIGGQLKETSGIQACTARPTTGEAAPPFFLFFFFFGGEEALHVSRICQPQQYRWTAKGKPLGSRHAQHDPQRGKLLRHGKRCVCDMKTT